MKKRKKQRRERDGERTKKKNIVFETPVFPRRRTSNDFERLISHKSTFVAGAAAHLVQSDLPFQVGLISS